MYFLFAADADFRAFEGQSVRTATIFMSRPKSPANQRSPTPRRPASANVLQIRPVERGRKSMLGVIAGIRIPARTFLGVYEGEVVDSSARDAFLQSLPPAEVPRHAAFDMQHPTTVGRTLVPVDNAGRVRPEFQGNAVLFINEASEPHEFPNVCYAVNISLHTLDVIALRDIQPGEELLAYYGQSYPRTYNLWWPSYTPQNAASEYYGGFVVHEQTTNTDRLWYLASTHSLRVNYM
jgi:hypothetical protein